MPNKFSTIPKPLRWSAANTATATGPCRKEYSARLPLRLDQDRPFAVPQGNRRDRRTERAVGSQQAVRAAEQVCRGGVVGERAAARAGGGQWFVKHQRVAVNPLVNAIAQCCIG